MKNTLAIALVTAISAQAYADHNHTEQGDLPRYTQTPGPYFNMMLGISPDMGILGVEVHKDHHAFGVGFPETLSYKYFSNPHGNSKFYSVYLGAYDIDEFDDYEDGVYYRNFESKYAGVGIGYRWQWQSGWNVTASIAMHYAEDEYSNPGSSVRKEETGFFPFPGIMAGFKF